MFEILRRISADELVEVIYWLGLRLRFRTAFSNAAYHRALANDPGAEGGLPPAVQCAIAQVLEEIEAAEGKEIHDLSEAEVRPYLDRMYAIDEERREPPDPELMARAMRTLEEMRRDYADVGRRKIA